ncbi:MAG: surface-adhesin E family protein [Gemmatimonadaceae bacterium]
MIRFAGRCAVIAACVVGPAVGAQVPWRQVYHDSDVTVIFDTASVTQQSSGVWNTVTSWDYTRPRILENKKQYTRLVERAYVRCSPVRIKRVRSTVYAPNNLLVRDEGEVDARDQVHMVWDRPKAGTAGRSAWDTVCGILTRNAGVKAMTPASVQAASKAAAKSTTTRKKAAKKR